MIRKFTFFSFLVVTFLAALLLSCKKFEGGQTVPAYIRIDTLGLNCDYYTYGSNTHKFVDAWVYVDDNIIGCYELPAMFPVLKEGVHKITVRPGIAVNGIRDARADYPFVAPLDFEVDLKRDDVDTLFPVFNYLPVNNNFHVRWKEDFDSGSITMEPTSQSDVNIGYAYDESAWHDPEGIYSVKSAKMTLTSDTAQFCIATSEEFTDLPSEVKFCLLEMDYKCSDTCAVGIFYMLDYTVNQEALVRLRPTCASGTESGQWNKIYINITPYLADYKDADYFKFYISSWVYRNDGPQYFYYDNLKLIYRLQ